MKSGVPWNVRGVRPQARDTAREAARRSGMSVGEWLDTVIFEQAAEEGVHPSSQDNEALELIAATNERLVDTIERLDRRLDNIVTQNLSAKTQTDPQLAKSSGPEAYAPKHYQAAQTYSVSPAEYAVSPSPVYAHAPLPLYAAAPMPAYMAPMQRTDQTPATSSIYSSPDTPPAQTAAVAQNWMSEIEQAFSEISRRQRALDDEPAEVDMRYEAPREQPVFIPPAPAPAYQTWQPPAPSVDLSGLEAQLRHITSQIEGLNRPSGVEEALAGLRRELSEITGTLTEALPRNALDALENEMRKVAERLTESHHYSGVDLSTVTELGKGLMETRDALRALTPLENLAGFDDAIRGLALKIDTLSTSYDPNAVPQLQAAIESLRGFVSRVASDETLNKLTDEVRSLANKVEQVASAAAAAAASQSQLVSPQLEAQLRAFTQQLQIVQQHHADPAAFGQLHDRIATLSDKLDASGARFVQFDAIERGLSEVKDQLQTLRGSEAPSRPEHANMPVEAIQRDISRAQDSLEAVHGTIDHVVDRLSMIETDLRDVRPATPQAAHSTPIAVMAAKPAAAERQPIDPDLPPDFPLEPGSGGPRKKQNPSAAERIAASEDALARTKPTGTNAGPNNFIAAARRAAQAATPKAEDGKDSATDPGKSTKTLSQRMRSLIAGASVILILVGGARLTFHLLEQSQDPAVDRTASIVNNQKPETTAAVANPVKQDVASAPPVLSRPETKIAAAAPASTPVAPIAPVKKISTAIPVAADVTGSISPKAATTPPAESLPSIAMPSDKFPDALRKAAMHGDPTAQYEIGARYLEGRGVSASLENGAIWLERAAKAGLAPAEFRLGSLYEKGQGVKKNVDTARALYSSAAQKGNAKAMHNMAVLYAEGAGSKPDYKAAALWFRKAADYGVSDSQYNLAILHARGIGVPKNLAESYKWFALAAAQGDKESAKKRDEVGGRLDADSLKAAKHAVEAFTPETQPTTAITVKAPDGGWEHAAEDHKGKKRPASGPHVTIGAL